MDKSVKTHKNGNAKQLEFEIKLLKKLKDVLSRIEVENNNSLNLTPLYELGILEDELKALIKGNKNSWAKDLWERYEKFISDEPFIDFFYEALDKRLKSILEFDSNKARFSLTLLDEFKDTDSLSQELVSELKSLPYDYKLFVELSSIFVPDPDSFFLKEERFQISDELALIRASEDYKTLFPQTKVRNPKYFPRLFSLSNSEIELYWSIYHPYLEITSQGYIGNWVDTTPVKNAQILIRSFFGLGYALGMLKKEYSFGRDYFLTVYQKIESKWIPQKARSISSELSRGIDSFALSQNTTSKVFRSAKDSRLKQLEVIKKVFENKTENERLLLASQWLFDSFCGDDQLLQFVKAAVCLEILLGEKSSSDLIGIGVLLGNRCAYLISSNKKEREEIIKDFKEIYETRSNIVHNGKNKLSVKERNSLYNLRALCRRVIHKEVELQGYFR